jgi:hypothetical protein
MSSHYTIKVKSILALQILFCKDYYSDWIIIDFTAIWCMCVRIAHTYWFFIKLSWTYQRSIVFVVFFLILSFRDSLLLLGFHPITLLTYSG